MEERRFEAGDIIYREGEESDAAFVINAGRVEFIKNGPQGPVRLSAAGKGDLFGEVGVLDKGPRSTTARAETTVTVRVIPREAFLALLQKEPQTTLKIMTRMARRLRAADERLAVVAAPAAKAAGTALVPVAQPVPAATGAVPGIAAAPPPARGRGGLVTRVMDVLRGARSRATGRANRPATVAVTPLSLDPEYDQRPYLIEALQGLEGVEVRPSKGDLPPPEEGQTVRDPRRARIAARQLVAEEGASLLIWGGEDETGRVIQLRFALAVDPHIERAGLAPLDIMLTIPGDFDETWHPLLRAVIMAFLGAAPPILLPLVEAARDLGLHPPETMSPGEAASVLAAFGYAAAAAGCTSGREDLLDAATTAYRDAIGRLPREALAEWAAIHKALGLLLQIRADRAEKARRGAGEAFLREAIEANREALSALTREDDPRGWAGLHARLGALLFRLDLQTGDEDALKEALGHLQSAAQVFTRAEDPWRWAELMNSIAQVLQVYGDHFKSVEALSKAVDVCRSACEVRTPETAPLLYAATRNNMGSALFLIAKYTGDPESMRLAAVAFRDALEVHRAAAAGGRLAAIIEKNLARAEDLLRRHEARSVAQPSWAGEEGPETALDVEVDALES